MVGFDGGPFKTCKLWASGVGTTLGGSRVLRAWGFGGWGLGLKLRVSRLRG